MDEKRNNRAVERKMSDCLRQDRARIQVGRISHFGLLEMSRQRIRASVLESSTEPCPTCGGTGHVRSVSSVALQLLRSLEEQLMKTGTHNYSVRTRTDVALYVLNHKRGHLRDLEEAFQVTLAVIADPSVSGQQSFVIERGEQVHTTEAAKALLAARIASQPVEVEEFDDTDEFFEEETEAESGEAADAEMAEARNEGEEGPRRRRRRRGRGRGRGEGRDAAQVSADGEAVAGEEPQAESGEEGEDESEATPARADQENGERRPRRRGRRGGRRRRGNQDNANGEETATADNDGDAETTSSVETHEAAHDLSMPSFDAPQPEDAPEVAEPVAESVAEAPQAPAPVAEPVSPAPEDDKPRRSTVREKVSFFFNNDAPAPQQPAPAAPAAAEEPQPPAEPAPAAPRRMGWWSRRSSE